MNWYIASEIETSDPRIVNMVTGGGFAAYPYEVFYRLPPKAGPFTRMFLEASFFDTKKEAEAKAVVVAAKYPYFIGKLRVERLKGHRRDMAFEFQKPGEWRKKMRRKGTTGGKGRRDPPQPVV